MKYLIRSLGLSLLCLVSSCVQKKVPVTKDETISALKEDPVFIEYISDKKELFFGMLYDEWSITIDQINNFQQDEKTVRNNNDLLNLYKQHGFNRRFAELLENIGNSSYNLKRKYELQRFPNVWRDLNNDLYSSLNVNLERTRLSRITSDTLRPAVTCPPDKLLLFKKNLEKFEANSYRHLWGLMGEFCYITSMNKDDFATIKANMDCRLMAFRNMLENINSASNRYSSYVLNMKCVE